MAAPATVISELPLKIPLAYAGKVSGRDDLTARKPAIATASRGCVSPARQRRAVLGGLRKGDNILVLLPVQFA